MSSPGGGGSGAPLGRQTRAFLPVVLQPEAPASVALSQVADKIEIELPRSYRLRVSGTTKPAPCDLCLICWNVDYCLSASVHVWLAVGGTDMRRGINGLALQVQQALGPDSHADLYIL